MGRLGVACSLLLALLACTPRATQPQAGTAAAGLASAACTRDARCFPTALVDKDDVEAAVEAEVALARVYDTPPPEGQPWFQLLPGTSRVLVVAPHATAQTREGRRKPADAGTGALALMLHRLAGCTVLSTTWASPADPNYDTDDAFKEALRAHIARRRPALVLDLHASHPFRPYDVDLGTMHGASLRGRGELLALLASELQTGGLHNLSQDFFPAEKQATVTKAASGLGVPAVQLEINASWMLPVVDGQALPPLQAAVQYQRFSQLLQALIRTVKAVDAEAAQQARPATP